MKLEIIIPTRNCAPYLRETLLSVGAAPSQVGQRDVVGFDQAYLAAVEQSNAEYVWLFADDDLVIPGAYNRILSDIRDVKPALLVAEAEVWNKTITRKLAERFLKNQPSSFHEFGNPGESLQTLAPLMTYVGSIVVRRDLWLKMAEQYHGFVGYRYITFAIPALILYHFASIYYESEPCSKLRYGHQDWIRRAGAVDRDFHTVVSLLPYSDETKRVVAPPPPLWLRLAFAARRNRASSKLAALALRMMGKRDTITHEMLNA